MQAFFLLTYGLPDWKDFLKSKGINDADECFFSFASSKTIISTFWENKIRSIFISKSRSTMNKFLFLYSQHSMMKMATGMC